LKFIDKLVALFVISGVTLYFLVLIWSGIHNMSIMSRYMFDMGFLSTNEFSIPVGQIVSYIFFSTICFFLRKYKLGLMISFSYIFNWGFLHASANFLDMMGKPTMGLFFYLASGLMMTVLVVVGFFREE